MNTSKTLFSKISNNLFLIFCIFVLSFVWTNFYLHSNKNSLITSIILILAFCIIYYPIKNKYNKTQKSKTHSKESKENTKIQMLLGNDDYTINLIKECFNLTNITQTSQNNHFLDIVNNIDYFFVFNEKELSENTIVNIYKTKQFNNIYIFCLSSIDFPKEQSCKFEIINFEKIYTELSKNNIVYNNNIKITQKQKLKISDITKVIFNKSKSKNYFWFGIMLLFSSFFTPYFIYYISIGTILILISLFSRFNKYFN